MTYLEDSQDDKDELYVIKINKINKIKVKLKVKGGFRYFSKWYLKDLLKHGSCYVRAPSSFINTMWLYKNEFIPEMIELGYKRKHVNIDDGYIRGKY